ncbi:hypothetical protein [uncultured Roseobacter sp.]|uniref:hypothetical protein n=1 Tax=uncultured Roseobacter sp. TaxID=114847 RepID=UPI0026053B3C|nr:hypothetical protein [uncultured Roseobacter sp.]
MLETHRNLDLSKTDFELIEAALHTQKKILMVQSEAGGRGARKKLTDLKHLMKRLNRATASKDDQPAGFLQMVRAFFTAGNNCPHTR